MPKSSRHCTMFLLSPPEKGMSSATHATCAPSSVMRRAMMRPMSPDPRITTSLPGRRPSMLTSLWAVPAVKTPAGLNPGMLSAPRGRSRQPMARMMAPAWMRTRPSRSLTQVTVRSSETSRTIVSSMTSMPAESTRSSKRAAYSGPVSSSLNVMRPKPLWMHWLRMPPSLVSRSMTSTERKPSPRAETAAARPAGPPPTMTTS